MRRIPMTIAVLVVALAALVDLAPLAPTPASAATLPEKAGPAVPCWEESPPCGDLDPDVPAADPDGDGGTGDKGVDGEAPPPIQISRSSGRHRPQAAEMALWYRTYRRELAAVETALGRLLAAREVDRPIYLVPPCRRLARALVALDRDALFPVPDLAADVHLKRALDRLAEAAVACLDQRFAASEYYLGEAERARREFGLALRRYGLRE